MNKGGATHSNLIIQFFPGETVNLSISSTAIEKYYISFRDKYKSYERFINGSYFFLLEAEIRNCLQGEIYIKATEK